MVMFGSFMVQGSVMFGSSYGQVRVNVVSNLGCYEIISNCVDSLVFEAETGFSVLFLSKSKEIQKHLTDPTLLLSFHLQN